MKGNPWDIGMDALCVWLYISVEYPKQGTDNSPQEEECDFSFFKQAH